MSFYKDFMLYIYREIGLFLLHSVNKQMRQEDIVDILGIPQFSQHALKSVAMKSIAFWRVGVVFPLLVEKVCLIILKSYSNSFIQKATRRSIKVRFQNSFLHQQILNSVNEQRSRKIFILSKQKMLSTPYTPTPYDLVQGSGMCPLPVSRLGSVGVRRNVPSHRS